MDLILPTEIVTHIFLSLPTVTSALSLASTCRSFHAIFHSSKRLLILKHSAEIEFGPLDDIEQLVTHNASQPAHFHREVPLSDALIRQLIKAGHVATQWEDIYMYRKWKHDYVARRLLSTSERFKLRRATYRLWLFDRAFHNIAHVRYARARLEVVRERAALLHNYTTSELAEMLDVHAIIRDVVANDLCPSNGRLRRKYQARYPETTNQPLFSIHLNYPPTASRFIASDSQYHNSSVASSKYHAQQQRWQESSTHTAEFGLEGWGDDIGHYYIVEDMMKLDPEQILYLREHSPAKSQVEAYVADMGMWFENNGETFSETLAFVIKQRGGEIEELKAAVEAEEFGVAVSD
ncbi:hypothetical protein B0A48_09414 [Cryoendolithus antarcticus]|uniref:F-box domain-containing protein n=1 Tax=Cryoendolithus antarcticus TaxID=1507870 RepID=A0A1V8T014_9PEZI|nr:hypothetical protein B0A48_09414 [Cryoendolithus antarcticus]